MLQQDSSQLLLAPAQDGERLQDKASQTMEQGPVLPPPQVGAIQRMGSTASGVPYHLEGKGQDPGLCAVVRDKDIDRPGCLEPCSGCGGIRPLGWQCPPLRALCPCSLQPPSLDGPLAGLGQQDLLVRQSLSQRLCETEAVHAETVLELEKTRDMLILQHRINRDYQVWCHPLAHG